MNKIIILAGFSASGKDTIAKKITERGVHFIVSHTTRPMRDYESEGNPYYFITEEQFLEMALLGQFVEHRKYNTILNDIPQIWHYGVHKGEVLDNETNVVVLDMMGVREFKEEYGDRCIVFFIDADEDTRRQRIISRGDYHEGEFNRRLEDDKKQFPFEVVEQEVNHIIKSTDPDENTEHILTLVAERLQKEALDIIREDR